MSQTFVIPDLHGRFDLMEAALTEIEGRSDGGTVIFLGDYIDRGPESRGVLERLIAGAPVGWTWVCLMGNHESMMIQSLIDPTLANCWYKNGGLTTIEGYATKPELDTDALADHALWCSELPLYYQDAHRVYAHAAVFEGRELAEQDPEFVQWHRYKPQDNVGYRGKHLVHGHTPVPEGPVILDNRTNMDVGAVFTGRLAVAVFDDEKAGGPQEVIWMGESA